VTDVFLECAEPPQGKPHLACVRKPVYVWPSSKQSDPDYVSACAESMRKDFDRLYGGRWIVVRAGVCEKILADGGSLNRSLGMAKPPAHAIGDQDHPQVLRP
jgi:hypothetical protein